MKRVLPYLLLIFLTGEIQFTYSWDSTIAKYMPLQVGNVWVYHATTQIFNGGTGYFRYKITGTFDSGGKKYFQVQQTYLHISGNPNSVCGIPFFNDLRLDSNTMNVYQLVGCPAGERLLDSLRSKINDTAWICGSAVSFSRCVDTNAVSIFSFSIPSKKFNNSGFGNATVYSKGLGITQWGFAEAMTQCNNSLRGCVINGLLYGDTSMIVGINQISTEIPDKFELYQNYPNPFNPSTKLKFQIPLLRGVDAGGGRGVLTLLKIFNTLGHEVQVLVNQSLQPGTYEVDWDASNYPSGVYFYELASGNFTQTKKMVLLK